MKLRAQCVVENSEVFLRPHRPWSNVIEADELTPNVEANFAAEVREFLGRHWPVPLTRHVSPAAWQVAADRWFAALYRRGWSVPAWPEAYGGPGWSLEQRFTWERAVALAQAPVMDPVGVGLVGPMIHAQGSASLGERYLDDIRAARSRWAAGLTGLSLEDAGLCAVRSGSDYALQGTLTGISDLGQATHALCLAATDGSGRGLFAVSVKAFGVARIDAQTLAFADAPADLLSPPDRGLEALDAALGGDQAPLARTAGAEAWLGRMKTELAAIADGSGGFLDGDAGFRHRLARLEVRLESLQALEARSLADRVARKPHPGLCDAKADLVVLGLAALEREIGELSIDVAGYYALPQPDPLLTDNEGPVGPGYALPPLEGMLRPLWALDAHRRRLTAQLMGAERRM